MSKYLPRLRRVISLKKKAQVLSDFSLFQSFKMRQINFYSGTCYLYLHSSGAGVRITAQCAPLVFNCQFSNLLKVAVYEQNSGKQPFFKCLNTRGLYSRNRVGPGGRKFLFKKYSRDCGWPRRPWPNAGSKKQKKRLKNHLFFLEK